MATITLPAEMPGHMKGLKRDEVGRPVPWFVPWIDGVPDFRMMDPPKLAGAIREQLCFLCGNRLHRVRGSSAPRGTFVAGPMCVVNRTSAEPPNHFDCAEWSSRACPFLSRPKKLRREANLPENESAAGIAILRNPGVTALIDSDKWSWYRVPADEISNGGILFRFDRITSIRWMAEGRLARTDEVLTSIETGLPELVRYAEMEAGGMRALAIKTRDSLRWVGGFDPADYPTIQATLAHVV